MFEEDETSGSERDVSGAKSLTLQIAYNPRFWCLFTDS
jgi:hypothetical protein